MKKLLISFVCVLSINASEKQEPRYRTKIFGDGNKQTIVTTDLFYRSLSASISTRKELNLTAQIGQNYTTPHIIGNERLLRELDGKHSTNMHKTFIRFLKELQIRIRQGELDPNTADLQKEFFNVNDEVDDTTDVFADKKIEKKDDKA